MHVIINGTSSETLQGLQVLSLPPITQPRMRTSVATIDGRPGDIVTKLGYEAYDRKIRVLLHHTYDPDRVYKFETIAAFGFERAVKFKTAEITFHVQPYKVKNPAESQTISGSSATVTNTGNTTSAPKLRISGSGTVTINIDGSQAFVITMPSGGIVIDSEALDAYAGNNLANRSVTGSYEKLWLSPGSHTISRSGGSVSSMVIENASRWI